MYQFRYYAIGHSYLKHGPFEGWQTEGFWGMAASEPSKDYFHNLQAIFKENFDCNMQAVAENHADYERLCVPGVTAEDYKKSSQYAHMRDFILKYKPNIITIFVGGGNTVANDKDSLTLFLDVLFDMVFKNKPENSVVVYVSLRDNLHEIAASLVGKYNFALADASFIHRDKSKENPYYAFKEYPDYNGKVEFRTHPNDLGHKKIAECIFEAIKDEVKTKISADDISDIVLPEDPKGVMIKEEDSVATSPKMKLEFNGFNVRHEKGFTGFSSAPGTGASISADNLNLKEKYAIFYAEIAVEGEVKGKKLELTVDFDEGCGKSDSEKKFYAEIKDCELCRYEFDVSSIVGSVKSFKLCPNVSECFIKVKSVGFEN